MLGVDFGIRIAIVIIEVSGNADGSEKAYSSPPLVWPGGAGNSVPRLFLCSSRLVVALSGGRGIIARSCF